MSWKDIVGQTAERAGASQAEVARILAAFQDTVVARLLAGEDARIPDLGTLSAAWRDTHTVRSVADHRKIVLDGRYVAKFKPTRSLRAALAGRTPQRWRDPKQQTAWRIAETLIGDLVLYHGARQPQAGLPADAAAARAALASAFGDAWTQVERAYETRVEAGLRAECDHLLDVARARWRSGER